MPIALHTTHALLRVRARALRRPRRLRRCPPLALSSLSAFAHVRPRPAPRLGRAPAAPPACARALSSSRPQRLRRRVCLSGTRRTPPHPSRVALAPQEPPPPPPRLVRRAVFRAPPSFPPRAASPLPVLGAACAWSRPLLAAARAPRYLSSALPRPSPPTRATHTGGRPCKPGAPAALRSNGTCVLTPP